MKKTNWLSLLLALMMCLLLLPAGAEAETVMETVTVSVTPTVDLPDNDEIFAAYVEREMYRPIYGDVSMFGTRGRDQLNATAQKLYDYLKPGIVEIAAGKRDSSQFEISDLSALGISLSYTAEDLGVDALLVDGNISGDAINAFSFAVQRDLLDDLVLVDALLNDCPYDLYWYDKSYEDTANQEYAFSYTMQINYSDNKLILTGSTISFRAASPYGNVYAIDTTKTGATSAAVANAQAIVDNTASATDANKLIAYRNEICALNVYNEEAASDSYTGGYGDPWQLIYVFDGDNSTNVVCEGYAKAFQYLCDLSTFDGEVYCYSVSGNMKGGTGEGPHMWNIVQKDSTNHLVDVTNCDDNSVGAPDKLFMISTPNNVTWTNEEKGYVINANNTDISYTYDAETLSLWGEDVLKLGAYTSGGDTSHTHTWGEVSYAWSDDYSACTASRTCQDTSCGTSESISATISESGSKATCLNAGQSTYTATFAQDWASQQTKEVATAVDPANHESNTVEVSDNGDGTHSAYFTCCQAAYRLDEAHYGGTANCITQATCEFCQQLYGELSTTHAFDANGKCTLCEIQAAAKVNDAYYLDFADALTAWTDETTLTLLDDVAYGDVISVIGENMVLELNGKTLDMSSSFNGTIQVGSEENPVGSLTIQDSVGGGTVKAMASAVSCYGTLNIHSGMLQGDVNSYGTVNMTGGSVICQPNAVFVNAGGIFNLSGGELSGQNGIYNYGGTVTITGSPSITGLYNGVWNTANSSMTIDGTPAISGDKSDLFAENVITFNTAPAYSYTVRKEEEGLAIQAGEGVVLEIGNFISAETGMALAIDAQGNIVVYACTHETNTNAAADSGTGTHAYTCSVCNAEVTEAHYGGTATCALSASCEACGAAYGEALGHAWADADCDTPKTCSVCNATEGEALGHTWVDADCDTPKTCSVCNITEGEALGHTWVDADCDTPKTCSVCNAIEGEALGHTWVDADCDTPKTCSVCNAIEGEALGHTEAEAVKENEVPASCETDGSYDNVVYCSVCDAELSRTTVVVPAIPHSYVTETERKNATCTEAGYVIMTCGCGEKQTTTLPATGHSYQSVVTAPACTTGGYTTYTCACGATYTGDEVAALGHTDGDIVADNGNPATCGADGSYDQITYCSVCKEEISRKTVTLSATGAHSYTVKVEDSETPATCVATGSVTMKCQGCDATEVQTLTVNAGNHASIITDAAVAPACESTGLTEGSHCEACDTVIVAQQTVAATGHSYGEGEITTAPTCTAVGTKTYTCSVCKSTKTEEVPATGHDYEAVTTDPTCTEQGYTTYTCSNCGDSYADAYVDPTGHSYGEWGITTEATCTESGVETRKCTNCEAIEPHEISAKGHDLQQTVAKDATCTESGNSAYYTCSVCGLYFSDAEGKTTIEQNSWMIEATGHATQLTAAVEPTCTAAGSNAYYTCSVCEKVFKDAAGEQETTVEAESLPIVAHSYSEPTFAWADDNTCTATYTCTVGRESHSVRCEVTSATEDATCTTPGKVTYTATVVIGEKTHTSEKIVDGQALGHAYGDPVFNWIQSAQRSAAYQATAAFTCTRCDEATDGHTLTMNADVVQTASTEGNCQRRAPSAMRLPLR